MRRIAFCLPSLSVALVYLACGSRTGLLVPEDFENDAAPDVHHDADGGADADAGFDVEAEAEGEADAPRDVQFRDVPVLDICPDAGSTLIYVLAEDNTLLSFYPPTLGFTSIGVIACPGEPGGPGSGPFSMAVDRRGIAYSVFQDGNLFRVDTASAACLGTTFLPNQSGFFTFGMGYVANTGDAGETLFVAEGDVRQPTRPLSKGLANIDTLSYKLNFVGKFTPPIYGPELTGTGDGRLFGFYTNQTGTGSHIIEVDKTSGTILADHQLQVGTPNDAYAFAYWGGVFWVFTGSTITTVTRFDPVTLGESTATTYSGLIVGAGVSTCAPQ